MDEIRSYWCYSGSMTRLLLPYVRISTWCKVKNYCGHSITFGVKRSSTGYLPCISAKKKDLGKVQQASKAKLVGKLGWSWGQRFRNANWPNIKGIEKYLTPSLWFKRSSPMWRNDALALHHISSGLISTNVRSYKRKQVDTPLLFWRGWCTPRRGCLRRPIHQRCIDVLLGSSKHTSEWWNKLQKWKGTRQGIIAR